MLNSPILVVQIANYEYGFFWYLYQDGTIQHEVKLTGILSTNGMSEGEVRIQSNRSPQLSPVSDVQVLYSQIGAP